MAYKKYKHGGPHDPDLAKVKKGLKYVESSNGLQMTNPKSSATGFYGQLYNAEELQYMSYLDGVNRQSFASDTTLQNKLFEDRYYGNIPKVPGLKGNAEDLRIEYQPQLAKKGIPFNYTDDEISALSNLLGRQGTREYLGYVLRDGRSLADVFPKIYGPDPEAPNKTPEKYLESYRKGRDLKYGGQVRSYGNGGPTDPPTDPPTNPLNPYDITQTDLTSFENVNQNQLRYMNSPVYLDRLRAEGVTNPEEIRDSRINNINNTIIQTNPNDITGATPVPFNNKGQYGVNFGRDLQDVKELYPGTTARGVYSHELSHIAGGNNNPDAIAPLSEGATRQLQSTNINWQNAPWQDAEGYKAGGYGYDPFYAMTDQRKLNSWKNEYPDMGLPPGTDYWDENTNSFVKLSPGGTSKIYGRPEMRSGRFNMETGSWDEDTYYVPEGYPKKEAQKYLDYLTEVEQLPKDQKAYVNNLRYKGGDPNNKETKWWKKTIGKGREGNIHDMRWFTKADGTNIMDDVEWKTIKDRGSKLFLRGEEYESPPMSQGKWADNLPLEGAETGRYKVLTDSHYGSAGEAKADLDGIRDFRETNYNFKREEETTPENWKQFIKDYKKSGIKDITIERTLEQYNEEDIIKNLNTIAMEQQGDFSTIAKYGGNMKQYKKGGRSGLWANIHAKRNRIKAGSKERMRKPGSKGAPTAAALKRSQATYGGMLPEYGLGGFLKGALSGVAGSVPIVGGMLQNAIGVDPNDQSSQAGQMFGGIGSMLFNPMGGAGKAMNAFAEDGGEFMPEVDYEAEGGEVIVGDVKVNRAYNGGTMKSYKGGGMHLLSGPKHSEGGMGIMQFGGESSYVFSDSRDLKVPKEFGKFNTFADAAKSRSKSLEDIAEMRMGGESYDKKTADLMEPLAMVEFENLFNAQEDFKEQNNIGNPTRTAQFGEEFEPNPTLMGGAPSLGGSLFPAGYGESQGLNATYGSGMNLPGVSSPKLKEDKSKLPWQLYAANALPGVFNMAKGAFGTAPTLELEREEKQDYRNFQPLMDTYLRGQGRSLALGRAGLEGSGATGSQIRAGYQAMNSGSQSQMGQFMNQLSPQIEESRRGTDTFNQGVMSRNDQKTLMEDEFAMQNNPANSFSTGLGQLINAGTNLYMDNLKSNNMGTQMYGMFGDFLGGRNKGQRS